MDYLKYLVAAGVPNDDGQHEAAVDSLEIAKARAEGLFWHKLKARYFMAGKMARLVVDNKVTRAMLVKPEWADYDVAPMLNVNAFGDNADWDPATGRPVDENVYDLPADGPLYARAIERNYWDKGVFPGEYDAVKAWYRRNGGEYRAWRLGMPVNLDGAVRAWHGSDVSVYQAGNAWEIVAKDKWLGFIPVKVRIGFEIDNVWREKDDAQLWFPLPNHDLRAPVTWSVLPGT